MRNWVTSEEMREILLEDDADPDELTVEKVEELLDELVEKGVWRRLGDQYQVVDPQAGIDFIRENR